MSLCMGRLYNPEKTTTDVFLTRIRQKTSVPINPDEGEAIFSTTASITTTSDTILREIENLFTLRDRSRVLDFLSAYPALANVLVETFFKIKEYFPTATLWLEVSTDPDEPHNTQMLVSVVTDLSAEEADANLQQFDKDWWLDEMVHAQGKLCIILRFR